MSGTSCVIRRTAGLTAVAAALALGLIAAPGAQAATFPQCPPVYADTGCQFLITVTANGTTVQQDSSQPPYENSDDALVGIVNNSSSPVSAIPLSVPNSVLFGFEGDGICNPGGTPIPSGCVPTAGSPPGTKCDGSIECSFPPPPGQPAGYVEPGALSGSTQNGYEGPTTWFSNVSADSSSGTVNFSPALQPGQSTYFSLEEPPAGAAIGAGSSPTGVSFARPPTVTSTGASFSGLVNPNGQATTAFFQYGLDLRYSKLGASGPNYTNQTPAQPVGGDFADHAVSAIANDLIPNALYHARLVATNSAGTSFGPDITFTTRQTAPPGSPTLGRTFNLAPVSGLVLIKVHGVLIPLTQLRQFPKNTLIDALNGALRVITAAGGHPASDAAAKGKKGKKGKTKTQSGTFGGAIFMITQTHSGLATMSLAEGAFKGAPSFAKCKAKAADVTATTASSKTLQLLRASAKGKFSTKGKYAAATVRGTKWTTADRCDGSQVHVVTGSVAVTDFVRHKTVVLHGGQSYLAKKP
jgi:hypothetical protein